jgi:hypothetical protein
MGGPPRKTPSIQAARTLASLSTDPRALELAEEFEDAMDAVEPTGGQRKRKGGAGDKGKKAASVAAAVEKIAEVALTPNDVKTQLADAVKKEGETGKQEVVKVVAANQKTIAQMIGAKVEALKRVALPVSAVVGAATVLNRPTVYGNIARVAAEVFRSALNTSVQSTWGQWGEAFLDMGRAGGVIAGTLAEQTAQGPVVPFALATMYVAWDANRQGKTMTQLLLEYGSAVKTSATRLTKGQVDAFQAALKGETAATSARVLKEIAGRIDRPAGEGAQQLSAAFASLGAPAMGSTGMVPGRAAPSPASALGSLASASPDVIADNTEARKAAAALLSLADLPKSDIVESPAPGANAAAAPAAVMEDEAPPGGRRRRRKTRRRVPKRKRITRKMPIFVY